MVANPLLLLRGFSWFRRSGANWMKLFAPAKRLESCDPAMPLLAKLCPTGKPSAQHWDAV